MFALAQGGFSDEVRCKISNAGMCFWLSHVREVEILFATAFANSRFFVEEFTQILSSIGQKRCFMAI